MPWRLVEEKLWAGGTQKSALASSLYWNCPSRIRLIKGAFEAA